MFHLLFMYSIIILILTLIKFAEEFSTENIRVIKEAINLTWSLKGINLFFFLEINLIIPNWSERV